MFLDSQSLTTPTETHDYPEWHKGRKHYALWYIEIHHPELLAYLSDLTEKFSNYLLHPNTRQFHITLYICGFLTEDKKQFDDDFIQSKFQQQLKILSQNQLNSFKLTTGKINSFSSALFIEIQDHENSLSNIRQLLSQSSHEIAALDYCPHITLGLYSAEFKAQQIFKAIETIDQKSFEIGIDQLNFGIYQAQVLQGPLATLHQLILNPKKNRWILGVKFMLQLILGGARSGKSKLAEQIAKDSNLQVVYIATAQAWDDEMRQRISHHQAQRPDAWRLIEEPLYLADCLKHIDQQEQVILVDCLTLWMSNLLMHEDSNLQRIECEKLLKILPTLKSKIVLVSNETGLGVIPMGEITRKFVDESGRLHQLLGQIADKVVFCIAGFPMLLKG